MGFLQHCFIKKNTPELRKKLEDLGYINGAWESPHFEYPYLKCYPNRLFGLFKGEGFYITEDDYKCDGKHWTYNPKEDVIDCGTNEVLFLSLAALRDDSDAHQWFICDKEYITNNIVEAEVGEWIYIFEDDLEKLPGLNFYDYFHKATAEEIIEHFKDN